MGQVWEARDETLGRPVAVKVISLLTGGGSRGDEARARFLREARITAQLQHPNIVTIHDLGETGTGDNRVPFLVMELVRGEGLDAVLRRGAVTLPDAARWGAQISDALADAHNAGIMHRDVKPSNILITPSGSVKVLDFGVARAADPYATEDRLTQTGFIVGTPPYMAPEQARGLPEPRSDLYALGCLLFELITGKLPFRAPDTMGYLSAHLTQQPPTPSSVRAGIPRAWDDLVLTLLHKDPTQRYPNAADLSQALRQLDCDPGPLHRQATGPSPSESQTRLRSRPWSPTPGRAAFPGSRIRRRAVQRWLKRSVLITLALGVVGALYGGYGWTQTQYYVGTKGEHIALYQGISQDLAWISLNEVHEDHPEIELKYLPAYQRKQVEETIAVGSLGRARDKVRELALQADACKKLAAGAAGASQNATSGSTPTPGPTLSEEEQQLVTQCDSTHQ
ncbi:serine/threonine-protein kinase [Streptomyces sp. NPDC001435]|uniref:serine/threonine-protein kinase n=1 Tax=unclassified Streptomyces TaxID=2593676 RepID=UPI0036CE4F9D